jgi:hypothetical protein
MIVQTRREVLERTMANFGFIDAAARGATPASPRVYEVTQLVNSFLMTLLQHWDDIEADWPHLPQAGVTWPRIESEPTLQARQCVGKIRDSLAHGLFVFEENDDGEIAALHMWTCPDQTTVDWHATISIGDMRAMLQCFVELAKRENLPFGHAKRRGDPCQ